MKTKPISPLVHGIIDYAFALALISVPSIIQLNKKAKRLYAINGLGVIAYSVFTKYPAGIKQVIPLSIHKKIDCGSLALIALETFSRRTRKDKRAVILSVSLVTAGALTVLLTDWKARQ